jgi:hypothetical protein
MSGPVTLLSLTLKVKTKLHLRLATVSATLGVVAESAPHCVVVKPLVSNLNRPLNHGS